MHSRPSSFSYRTDFALCEYLVVAYLDEAVYNLLREEQEYLSGIQLQQRNAGFITIASFQAKEVLEETLTRWIQNICNLHHRFTLTLNNYSGIPPHSIFIRIQEPQPVQRLASALKILDGFIQSNDCPPLTLPARHFLPLASGLPEPVYEAAIKAFAQRSFHASFSVDKLVLLKRDHQQQYEIINTFTLPHPPQES